MPSVKLTHAQVNATARQYADELGDAAYSAFLLSLARLAKRRTNLNKNDLLRRLNKAVTVPSERLPRR